MRQTDELYDDEVSEELGELRSEGLNGDEFSIFEDEDPERRRDPLRKNAIFDRAD